MKVQDLMTADVLALDVADSVAVAKTFMREAQIRHLPVVDEGRFVGLVTQRDMIDAVVSLISRWTEISVGTIMRRDVSTVSPETDIRIAIHTMMEHKYGCLPVVQDSQLVGILTESDFLKFTLSLLE